ncbi:extracellular solute-binding protein [candidate division KSB1 bacterium]|nr:extracellular solute-binding protein [candidate division KSB1 bacterium]MBL7093461.1 extracellular solute-binding protein [candidate division KSB1 bacterium]
MNTATKVSIASILIIAALFYFLLPRQDFENDISSSESLIFFCAAGIKPPVEKVAKEFEEIYGIKIQLQYGGSGTLLTSLRVAKDADLYLAGDNSYIDIAREKGLVAEGFPLAYMRPVIGVQKLNPKNIFTIDDLLRKDIKISLGNPNAASIGKQTKKILEKIGKWQELKNHVEKNGVFKPTVPEIANDIKIGSVDAGIIWNATANQYPEIEAIHIPIFDAEPKQITLGVLKSSKQPTNALRFARYLSARDKGLITFKFFGYDPVDGDKWAWRPEVVLFSGGLNRIAIKKTLKDFQKREGVSILTTYNGCGILVGEMRAGQRPDGYFACDKSYLEEINNLFLDEATISETDIVLLTQKGNPKKIKTLHDLTQHGIKIAVANAKYSALGGLTNRLLKEAGIYEAVQKNITYGDAPTADYLTVRVKTGREDVAILYLANTIHVHDELDVIPIHHPAAKAVQPIAIGKSSEYKYLMGRLISAIQSDSSKQQFESTGFRWRVE